MEILARDFSPLGGSVMPSVRSVVSVLAEACCVAYSGISVALRGFLLFGLICIFGNTRSGSVVVLMQGTSVEN